MDAVDFAAAGQRSVQARQRPRGAMAVGPSVLSPAPFAGIDRLDLHQRGGIGQRLEADRLGVLEGFGKQVFSPGRRRVGSDDLCNAPVVALV